VSSAFKLCMRDYFAARWWWLIVLASVLFFGLVPLYWGGSQAFMINGAFLALGALACTLFIEDMFKTEAYAASLPLKRSSIVLGRYLLAGMLILAGGLIIFAFGYVLTAGSSPGPAGRAGIIALLTIEGAAGYVVVLTMLVALFLPLYFRYGLFKGSLAYFAGLIAFLLAGAAADTLLSSGVSFTARLLKEGGPGIVAGFYRMRTGLGWPLFLALIVLVEAVTFAFSSRLSAGFYNGRDL